MAYSLAGKLVVGISSRALFDEGSELVFQREGIDGFHEHEAAREHVPMSPGPFAPFLLALKRIQDRFPEGKSPIRTALVTARGAPAHRRVVNTLRAWGVRRDETFFLGGIEKAPVLAALRPHIFFGAVGARPPGKGTTDHLRRRCAVVGGDLRATGCHAAEVAG